MKYPFLLLLFVFILLNSLVHSQEIYSKAYGNPKNSSIIFIHGGPRGNATLFEGTTAGLIAKKGFYVIVYDRREITGWIPVFGKYKPEIEGFPYNKEKDEYSCPMNRPLPLKGFHTTLDGTAQKIYRTSSTDCKVCPMKSTCVPNKSLRQITRTIYDEEYLRANSRQHSKRGRQMKKLRQSTVEPVFGSLTQYYSLRKIGVLGKAGAHKVMLMAAIAFNLKKYLKIEGRKSSHAFIIAIIDALYRYFSNFLVIPIKPKNQYHFS